MWSDSIFTVNDRSKLHYLAKCCAATYGGTIASISAAAGTTVTQRTYDPLPRSFTWLRDGERIVCVEGSIDSSNYPPQLDGWIFATSAPGGLVNTYYHSVANSIYLSVPNDTSLCVGHSRGGAIAANLSRRLIAGGRQSRTVSFGSPRFASAGSAAMPYWGQCRMYSSPLDMVREIPYNGFAGVDWRLPAKEMTVEPSGIREGGSNPSTLANLIALASVVGDSYHSIASYVNALAPLPVWTVVPTMGVGDMYRVTVRGVMHEQSVINEFWYQNVSGVNTAENLAGNFSSRWATMVCPLVSAAYSVLQYDVRKLFGAAAVDPVVPAQGSTWRWSEQFIRTGTAADVGLVAAGVAFPSFVAIGFTKSVGGWFSSESVAVPGLKIGRGSGRISGPAEEFTAASGGNRLIPTAVSSWTNVMEQLRWLNVAGTWQMAIATYTYAGAPITSGDPPVPSWRYAYVNSVSINPFLTSQTSRKQRIGNLG